MNKTSKKVCFSFSKQVEINKQNQNKLSNLLSQLIDKGYSEFYIYPKDNFNAFCFNLLKKLKYDYMHIKLIKVISVYEYLSGSNAFDINYDEISPAFNREHPQKISISDFVVQNSDLIICYTLKESQITSTTIKMHNLALKLHKSIIYT